MKLAKYLQREKLSFEQFGQILKPPASKHTVLKWVKGLRDPRPKRKVEIRRVTGGEVTGEDWMPDE